jgi:hypothetical protein
VEAVIATQPDPDLKSHASQTHDALAMAQASIAYATPESLGVIVPDDEEQLNRLERTLDEQGNLRGGDRQSAVRIIDAAMNVAQILLRSSIGGRPGNYRCTNCGLPGSAPGAMCRACGGIVA